MNKWYELKPCFSYGKTRSMSGGFGTACGFTGQYIDGGSGLHYCDARYVA